MMTRDFAQRTRARITEAREALTRLHAANKETLRQLARINKQHVTDRARTCAKLGELAEDVVVKLPAEATETDVDRAYALQEEVVAIASEVEEVSLAENAIEDLGAALGDQLKEIYVSLKDAEVQLSKMERLGAKLDV